MKIVTTVAILNNANQSVARFDGFVEGASYVGCPRIWHEILLDGEVTTANWSAMGRGILPVSYRNAALDIETVSWRFR